MQVRIAENALEWDKRQGCNSWMTLCGSKLFSSSNSRLEWTDKSMVELKKRERLTVVSNIYRVAIYDKGEM